MKITIIGGGPAGLYFAILMKKLDPANDITVYERDARDDTYGWGIVFSRATLAEVRGTDFDGYADMRPTIQTWDNVDVVHKGEKVSIYGNDFAGISRIEFLQVLRRRCEALGVNIHYQRNVTSDEIPAMAAGCDLFVGADGVMSQVRDLFAEHFKPDISIRRNKYTWLGTPQVFDGLTMIFREHQAGLFIGHAYRFSPAMSTFVVECDPQTWDNAGFANMSGEEERAYLAEVFKDDLDGKPLLSHRSDWINFNIVKNRHWYHQNIVLLGDALHTAHFSIGSGTKLALEDAIALAGAFAENEATPAALKAFELARKPRVDSFQDAALDSLVWLENVHEQLHLAPVGFAYGVMTRSGRVRDTRLRAQDAEFMQRYEVWRREHEGPIPHKFLDLFEKKTHAHLAILMKDGTPHVSPVWVDYDGECVIINSGKGRLKDIVMRKRPNVAIEIQDPENPDRYVMVRGVVVEITEEGADEHLDKMARRYLNRAHYPHSWRFPGEIRCIYKIRPDRVFTWNPFE